MDILYHIDDIIIIIYFKFAYEKLSNKIHLLLIYDK